MMLVSSGRLFRTPLHKSLLFMRYSSSLSLGKYNNDFISVTIDDIPFEYNNVFLRDACSSAESIDPYSKQKSFSTAKFSGGLALHEPPRIIKDSENEDCLEVAWNKDGSIHKSIYTKSFLKGYSTPSIRREGKYFDRKRINWDNSIISGLIDGLQVKYNDYLNDNQLFFKTLKNLNEFGLCFVNELPDPCKKPDTQVMNESNAMQFPVATLASKFGYIKKTFYGTLFDVKNEKEAKNIANTNTFLPLHMDLLYYESPPGLQLLHFIQNSTQGGENIFCDSFAAAKHVRDVDPDAFLALTKVPITYHYDNNNEYYYYSRPLIVTEAFNDIDSNFLAIKEVNYSPPFQGPFEFGINEDNSPNNVLFKSFLRGFRIFDEFVNDPANQFQLRMQEGSCAIFDNRRVLHSRTEFSDHNGGDRWLMGCYVDGDSFRSKLRVACKNMKIAGEQEI